MGKNTARGVAVALAIGFVLVGVQLAVAGQSHGPTPVTVTNTPLPVTGTWTVGPPTMTVVTLADDLQIIQTVELAPIDVSAYEFVSFLGTTNSGGPMTLEFAFSADAGPLVSGVAAAKAGTCNIEAPSTITPVPMISGCSGAGYPAAGFDVLRIAGPILRVWATNGNGYRLTLKAVLRRR